METLTLSTTTTATICSVVIAAVIFTLFRRRLSTMLVSIALGIILIFAFEAVTGYRLVDFGQLWAIIVTGAKRFLDWIANGLLPGIQGAVEEVADHARS